MIIKKATILKKWQVVLLAVLIAGASSADADGKRDLSGEGPVFSRFVYQGDDQVYKDHPLEPDEFYTPILQGCYPDPAIINRGDDYFMVHSSFAMVPGVPIFHSKDLVNWKQIGHVLDRPSQLKVEHTGISAGVYAPAIKYNPHNETFYMITTQFAGDFGNMVVTSKCRQEGLPAT